MPLTYSINDNTAYEATRLGTISDVLNQIPDNTSKLISPKDVRDAIYSSWETSVFKQTTGSASVEYIGVDKNGLNNKMLIGKKRISGLDVLSTTLLNYNTNDTDIFFFNNKSGSTISNTKVAFLAGTNSLLYQYAPYFNSYQGTSSLHLDIVNQSGDITIDSSSGRVSINNVVYPTKVETASASNGQILKYYNGRMVWGDNTINLATIGSTSSVTNIYGSPILINGYNIELDEVVPIIATFGNIKQGQIFSNAPVVEVLRQMIYPYLGPKCSLLISANGSAWGTHSVAEYGNITSSNILLNWSITKRSDPIIFATISNATLFSPSLPISTPGLTSISSPPYANGNIPPFTSLQYDLVVTDSGVSNYALDNMAIATGSTMFTTSTASVTLDLVYPFFVGMTTSNATSVVMVNAILGGLQKKVESKSDKTVYLSGTGYIYFIYPFSYGPLSATSSIFDENGFDISGSFTNATYLSSINSPSVYWSSKDYRVYKFGPTTVSGKNWIFKF